MAPFGDVSIHVWSTWNLPVFIRQTEPSTVVRILFARSYLATVLLLDTRSPLARSFDPWLLRRTVRRAVRSDIWHERVHCLEGALLDQHALVCQPSAISHPPSAISHQPSVTLSQRLSSAPTCVDPCQIRSRSLWVAFSIQNWFRML